MKLDYSGKSNLIFHL